MMFKLKQVESPTGLVVDGLMSNYVTSEVALSALFQAMMQLHITNAQLIVLQADKNYIKSRKMEQWFTAEKEVQEQVR